MCDNLNHSMSVRILSQYKTHIGLEIEVCFCSNQDANSLIMIVLPGNIQSSEPILYKHSQGEEQNKHKQTSHPRRKQYSTCTSVYRVRGTPTPCSQL